MKKDKKTIELERTRKVNALIRLTLCSIGLCVAMTVMLVMFYEIVPGIADSFEDKEKMEQTIWAIEHLAYLPPSIVTVLSMFLVFGNKERYVPVQTQRHKAIVAAVIIIYTYGIMFAGIVLGRTLAVSFEAFSRDFSDFINMFDVLVPWFLVQAIPLSIIFSYHMIRSASEKKELVKNEQ